jgi:diacylglycerol kinase family enzyme
VRIRFFGNILRELVPGASLERNDLRAVMCRTASRNAYLRYVAGVLLGRQWKIAGIDLVSCSEIVCQLPKKAGSAAGGNVGTAVDTAIEERVYVEADGELLGRLPARMTMVPDALSLVVPSTKGF